MTKIVLKIAYSVTVAGLGGGGAIAVQARDTKDWLATACNFTKDIDLNIANALETKGLLGDLFAQDLGATSLHKVMHSTESDEDGEYMNWRVKMDNTGLLKSNSEPEKVLKEWIQTYLDTGAQLQFRELSECERVKQLENRFRLQNLFSERTLPPEGVKFENGDIVDNREDGIHRTYVERIVFVANARGSGTIKKDANKVAIKNFRTELKALEGHTYIGLNPNTGIAGKLVGCMEFKKPMQLWHMGKQGIHYFNNVIRKYLKILSKTHDFTVYHLGKGNGVTRVTGQEELEWIPTRDWQTLPIINSHILKEIHVPRNTSQLNALEMFKRAAVSVDQKRKYMGFTMYGTAKVIQEYNSYFKVGEEVTVIDVNAGGAKVKNVKGHTYPVNPRDWSMCFKQLPGTGGITKATTLDAAEIIQFGYPCEFKTPAFMEPFKFYTKYEEGLKQVHGPDVKLNHHMQVIRTITDGNIFGKESVELKRARALEMLRTKVKILEKQGL